MVLFIHVAAPLAMFGLIWFVQVVHYPLLGAIGCDEYRAYHDRHLRRTGFVIAPLMIIEALSGFALTAWPGPVPPRLALAGLLLIVFAWISTFVIQVPCHRRLSRGFDERVWLRLVRTNWIRTVVWSCRAGIVLAMLASAMGP